MPGPSNAQIMQALGRIEEKVDAVAIQATKTNGRVDTIEQWKNGLMAVEQYKKETQAPVQHADQVIIQQRWYNNNSLVAAVVALASAIAVAIGVVFGVKQ